jgi:hypothetical protein
MKPCKPSQNEKIRAGKLLAIPDVGRRQNVTFAFHSCADPLCI